MKYYIKKLKKQELGSKANGQIARGRYIYISKKCENFFPFLSKTVTNDNVLIPIIAPFSDAKIYCAFVYHNDKYNTPDGSRNEYRIYLNNKLDPNRDYFQVNDIIVFQRIETESLMPIYLLHKFSATDEHYSQLEEIIESSPITGSHALVSEDLFFIQQRNLNLEEVDTIIPTEVIETIKEQQAEILAIDENVPEIEEIRGASLFGPDSFRDFVLMAYGYKCAITGKSISYKNLNNLEAAHIQPKAQSGTYLPCNGMALSRDMHWAFDKGFISISDDFKIIVHTEMKDSELKEFDGKPLNIPLDPYFQPERKFLRHHRDYIFGLFLYSGAIRNI